MSSHTAKILEKKSLTERVEDLIADIKKNPEFIKFTAKRNGVQSFDHTSCEVFEGCSGREKPVVKGHLAGMVISSVLEREGIGLTSITSEEFGEILFGEGAQAKLLGALGANVGAAIVFAKGGERETLKTSPEYLEVIEEFVASLEKAAIASIEAGKQRS